MVSPTMSPSDADVPLRRWLLEHFEEEAVRGGVDGRVCGLVDANGCGHVAIGAEVHRRACGGAAAIMEGSVLCVRMACA